MMVTRGCVTASEGGVSGTEGNSSFAAGWWEGGVGRVDCRSEICSLVVCFDPSSAPGYKNSSTGSSSCSEGCVTASLLLRVSAASPAPGYMNSSSSDSSLCMRGFGDGAEDATLLETLQKMKGSYVSLQVASARYLQQGTYSSMVDSG